MPKKKSNHNISNNGNKHPNPSKGKKAWGREVSASSLEHKNQTKKIRNIAWEETPPVASQGPTDLDLKFSDISEESSRSTSSHNQFTISWKQSHPIIHGNSSSFNHPVNSSMLIEDTSIPISQITEIIGAPDPSIYNPTLNLNTSNNNNPYNPPTYQYRQSG